MPIRSSAFAITASLSAVLLAGCADGGSSATHAAGTVPVRPQGSALGAQASSGRQVHSGVRRTQSAPVCSGTGAGAFIGGAGSAMFGINVAGGEYAVVAGGENNQACDAWSTIAGGYTNAVSGSGGPEDGFIGGGENNVVTGYGQDSSVVGGDNNVVSNNDSAIVGGQSNSVAATFALLAGGQSNTIASGGTYGSIVSGYGNKVSGEYGFIGAGTNNTVSAEGGYIAAGGYNTVSGVGAVIDGGFNSAAAGQFATIPGGYVNSAAGTYSFAAGARASAAQTGTFVWSDGSNGDTILSSARAYEFLARASGGVVFYTNPGATIGVYLAPGSGTWASVSDRNLKTDVVRIDDAAVLDKVATLPIERWSYKSERGVRHVGPMAQDFYAAFKVGEDDKHITSIDEDGVALAAIKALHGQLRVQEKSARGAITTLRAENAQLRLASASQAAKISAVEAQLARLSAQMVALRER